MALVQGELVHHQAAYVARLEGPYFSLQTALVEGLEGVPVQAGEAADLADRQQLQQALEPDPQALGQAGGRRQPVDPLRHAPAAEAVEATHRQLQQHPLVQQVTLAHLAHAPLVDQRAGLVAAATHRQTRGLGLQADQQRVGIGLATGNDVVAWPESGKINRMHGDSRGWGLVCLATANLPASLTVNSLFPQTPRRTKS
ncbi:hypothetical protein FQZ97_575800 [compost metagenome]